MHIITTKNEILEEFKNILTSEKNINNDCISLYELSSVMNLLKEEYDKTIKSYKDNLDDLVYLNFGKYSSIILYGFNFSKNELKIGFSLNSNQDFNDIVLSKIQGDLYIKKTNSYSAKKVLASIGGVLSNIYDEYLKHPEYENFYSIIKPVNSNFLVRIRQNGISIFINSLENKYIKDFELSFNYNNYEYDCNSYDIISTFKDNEEEIFKRIFVKIKELPEFLQSSIFEIRQKQLEEINQKKHKNFKEKILSLFK